MTPLSQRRWEEFKVLGGPAKVGSVGLPTAAGKCGKARGLVLP
jgi:hypothetical protein